MAAWTVTLGYIADAPTNFVCVLSVCYKHHKQGDGEAFWGYVVLSGKSSVRLVDEVIQRTGSGHKLFGIWTLRNQLLHSQAYPEYICFVLFVIPPRLGLYRLSFHHVLVSIGCHSTTSWSLSIVIPPRLGLYRLSFHHVLVSIGCHSTTSWFLSVVIPPCLGLYRLWGCTDAVQLHNFRGGYCQWWIWKSGCCHTNIYLHWLRKATKSPSHCGQSPGPDLNPGTRWKQGGSVNISKWRSGSSSYSWPHNFRCIVFLSLSVPLRGLNLEVSSCSFVRWE
jgi:hypothetical protein